MEEIIYFELNHWSTEYHPDAEPFLSWMSDYYETPEDEEKSWIRPGKVMDKWYKDNELCAVVATIDMSVNFCITAKKSWIEKNCPELLTKYTEFLVEPDKDGNIEGRFGNHFVEWSKENIGLWYDYEKHDSQRYLYYDLKKYNEK